MTIKRRLSKLEERTPENPIRWDGDPETAEAYVRAKAKEPKKLGRRPEPFKGKYFRFYVLKKVAKKKD